MPNVTVKAPRGSDVTKPAFERHRLGIRWARPRVFSGGSSGRVGGRCAGGRPPADGLLVGFPDHQALELGSQSALGHPGGVGTFAQDVANGVVAVASAARFALAGTLVVAWAQCSPAGQALRRAEAGHVVTDLDEDQGSGDLVDAWDGLQQAVSPGVGLHGAHQVGVDVAQLPLQRLGALAEVAQHEEVVLTQVAVQAGGKIFGLALQGAARMAEQHRRGLTLDQAAHHGAGRNAMDVGHHGAELVPVACDQAQFAQVLGRDEAAAYQTEAGQDGQSLGVEHVGPATRRCCAPVSWKTPRTKTGSGLFTVRAATRSTAMEPAAPQLGVRASSVEVWLGNGAGLYS